MYPLFLKTSSEVCMKRLISVFCLSLFMLAGALAQSGFTINDLLAVKRVSDPQLSPDGKLLAFTIGTVDKAANKVVSQIWTVKPDGTGLKFITPADKSSSSPRWSPDGKKIAYTTGGQIWTMDPDGDDKKQVTHLSTGAGNPVWSPDGRLIAFNSDVYPECSNDDCNKAEDEKAEKDKVQAKVTDRLLFRHWVEWRNRKRAHVFIVASSGGIATDLTPGEFDAPPYGASTGTDYAFSPDSKELTFLKNPDKIEAISTNSDVITLNIATKSQKNITVTNKGYDAAPVYTPDGKYLLYRSMATEGFEADRWRIMRYNRATGETVELTRGFDQQADEITLSPDGKTIYFVANYHGRQPVFSVPVEPDLRLRIGTHVKEVLGAGFYTNLNPTSDGRSIVLLSSSMNDPAAVYLADIASGTRKKISPAYPSFNFTDVEETTWKGALNVDVHGWVIKPKGFDASKKYPLIVIIHGGPQGAFNDNWGYRWNPQIFANAGYVVFMPNPRGSTGWGQQFVNDVSGDWGGKAFTDIKNGIADVIKKPYIDKTRIGGAGASYGGYMIDWFLGHNNDPRFKFKTLVSHAGVYNLESMATSTEELWFVNWEFKGMPWQNRTLYEKWSPNRFINNFSTPTLVTAGELDYRVPYDQSLQLYTALQVKGVDSKLILFPDEGHWILKPQNSEFWYNNVLDWFGKHLK
jgi:dipeptidyl aminopeptidase/acylaminoacyl peptidase